MASYQQLCYCKNCKKNVSLDNAGKCKTCGSSQIKKSWTVRFRIIDFNGEKQKRLTGFETKKKAETAYMDFMTNYSPFKIESNSTFIFDDLLNKYFQYCLTENAESTIYDKHSVFELYITPYFKGIDINKITKEDLMNWQNCIWHLKSPKTNQNFSWQYLTKIRGFFFNFLNYCEAIYDIPNKLKNIKIPKNKSTKKEIRFWELETFNKFIDTIDEPQWKTLWMVFMFTGARFNEVRALSDNDIIGNTLKINKALVNKSTEDNQRITPTKNYKIVIKQIPSILEQQIKEYKIWKKANDISNKFLFGGDKPLSEGTIRRHLTDDIKKAKVAYISPHGFRHSYVSLLIHLGVSSKIIAELIGDREEQIIKTYGHLYSNAKDEAIKVLDAHLNGVF